MSTKNKKGNVVIGNGDFQVVASRNDPTGGLTTTTATSAYSRPEDYQTQCKTAWNDYDGDPLFGFLIDRFAQFGINGTRWHLENKEEQAVWDEWAKNINNGIIDIIPGLDEVEKWLIKNLALTGMVPCTWEWRTMRINGKDYQVPAYFNVLPSANIKITNENNIFGKNVIKYTDPSGKEITLQRNNKNQGCFVLKYNYTPADMLATGTVVRTSYDNVATTLYPKPPFLRLHEDVDVRMKLREMDRDTIINFLNRLYLVLIGDEAHPPQSARTDENGAVIKKGTIEEVADRINDATLSREGAFRTLYLPYYVKIEDKTISADALMNFNKYIASTLSVLSGFGILVVPGNDARLDFTDLNVQSFEQMIDYFRIRHIARFIEGVLCKEIVARNKGKLTEVPSIKWNQLNTKTNEFRREIVNLMRMGKVDTKESLEFFGLNKKIVVSNLREELGDKAKDMSEKEMFDANVPIAFSQTTVDTAGQEKKTDTSGTKVGGRPQGSGE
jgi:hypothetical protein